MCGSHKTDDMILLVGASRDPGYSKESGKGKRLCEAYGCNTGANYGTAATGKKFCFKHKTEGMQLIMKKPKVLTSVPVPGVVPSIPAERMVTSSSSKKEQSKLEKSQKAAEQAAAKKAARLAAAAAKAEEKKKVEKVRKASVVVLPDGQRVFPDPVILAKSPTSATAQRQQQQTLPTGVSSLALSRDVSPVRSSARTAREVATTAPTSSLYVAPRGHQPSSLTTNILGGSHSLAQIPFFNQLGANTFQWPIEPQPVPVMEGAATGTYARTVDPSGGPGTNGSKYVTTVEEAASELERISGKKRPAAPPATSLLKRKKSPDESQSHVMPSPCMPELIGYSGSDTGSGVVQAQVLPHIIPSVMPATVPLPYSGSVHGGESASGSLHGGESGSIPHAQRVSIFGMGGGFGAGQGSVQAPSANHIT